MILLNTLSSTIHCAETRVKELVSFCTGLKLGASTQCESVKYAAAVAALYTGKEEDKAAANRLMKNSKEALKEKKIALAEFQQLKLEEAHNALKNAQKALEENFKKHWEHFPWGAVYAQGYFDKRNDATVVNSVYQEAQKQMKEIAKLTYRASTHLSGTDKDAKALQDLIGKKEFTTAKTAYGKAVIAIGNIVDSQNQIIKKLEENATTLKKQKEALKEIEVYAKTAKKELENAQEQIEAASTVITDELAAAETAFKKNIQALTADLKKNKKYAKLSEILDSMTIAEGYQVFEQVK
jgi:esterase/lipase